MVDKLTNKNISLSDDDYNEFLSISKELAELFPDLVVGYDSQGNALLNLSGNANTVTESLNQLLKAERALADEKILKESKAVWENVGYKNTALNVQSDILRDKDFQAWLGNLKLEFSGNSRSNLISDSYGEEEGDKLRKELSAKYGVSEDTITYNIQEALTKLFGAATTHEALNVTVGKPLPSDFNIETYIKSIPNILEDYSSQINQNGVELIPTILATLRSNFQYQLDSMSDQQQANSVVHLYKLKFYLHQIHVLLVLKYWQACFYI